MSLPTQPAAYTDCYDLFQRAIDNPLGVRTPFPTENAAKFFQLRMHQARKLLREQNCRIYPSTSALYDTSEFDSLQVQVRGPDGAGEHWIYVRPHGVVIDYVEPLGPGDTVPEIVREPVLQITHNKETAES